MKITLRVHICISRLIHVSFIHIWLLSLICQAFYSAFIELYSLPPDHCTCPSHTSAGLIKCASQRGARSIAETGRILVSENPKSETKFLHLLPLQSLCLSFSIFQTLEIIPTSTLQVDKVKMQMEVVQNMRNRSCSY